MRQLVVKMGVALALVAAGYAVGRAQTSFSIVSGVVPAELAKVTETGPWGAFHTYFDSGTSATAAVMTGYADIQPGQQIHAPQMDRRRHDAVSQGGRRAVRGAERRARPAELVRQAAQVLCGEMEEPLNRERT